MGFKYNPLLFSGFDLTGSTAYSGYKAPVTTVGNLPLSGNNAGDMRVTLDTDEAWVWDADNSRWVNVGLRSSLTIGNSPNSQGYSLVLDNSTPGLTTRELELQPANASFPGIVTTQTQSFSGDKTFTDSVIIQGDLTVQGTTTSIDSQTLDVEDANITINNGGNDATAEGAGLTVDRTGTSGSIVYEDALTSKWKAGALGSEVEIVTVSGAQTLTNKTIDADQNSISNIENADIKVGAAINAAKIADGSVSNAEFQTLDGVTSAIQTQLNGKQPVGDYITELTGDVTATGPGSVVATISGLDATKIANGSVSNTEFQYINSLTSNAQDQLDDKADLAYVDLTFIPLTEKGAALGVATLDGGGKVPASQLPNSIMDYLGQWAASTNTPTLADGVGNPGDVYQASDAGTVNFGSGNITFAAGDWVIYSGTVWQKSINSNAVASVNGFTGIVSLDTDDIPEGSNEYFTNARSLAAITGAASSVTTADLSTNQVVVSNLAGKITTSSVTSIELGSLLGVTSNVQDQLDDKQIAGDYITELTGDVTATGPGSVVATISALDASKIANGTVSNTEFQYINSLSSNAQDQLDDKQPVGDYITELTGDITAIGPGSVVATISSLNATKIANGSVDNTEFQSLNGVTSNIQTQLDDKQSLSTITSVGDLYVGTGSATTDRLPVPPDGGKLVPDFLEPLGWRSADYKQTQGRPGKNYIQYPDAEHFSVFGWTLGTTGTLTNGLPTGTPSFTGAAPSLLLTASATNPIAGTYSYVYQSTGPTVVGNMFASQVFTIDSVDQAKVLTVRFAYRAQTNPQNANWSGTSANSFAWAIWDVTNSAWIVPAGAFGMTQSSGVGICTGTFQTSSNATQYRLVVYNSAATTGSTTVYFDDFFVGPQTAPQVEFGVVGQIIATGSLTPPTGFLYANGAAVSRSLYSDLFSAIGTSYGVGDGSTTFNLPDLRGVFASGAGSQTIGPTTYTRTLGTKQNDAFASHNHQFNTFGNVPAVTNNPASSAAGAGGTHTTTSSGSGTETRPANVAVAYHIQFLKSFQMSNDTDTRVVVADLNSTSTQSIGTGTAIKVLGWSASADTHAAFNSGSQVYVIPVSGYYSIRFNLYFDSVTVASTAGTLQLRTTVNGTAVSNQFIPGGGVAAQRRGGASECVRLLRAGDQVQFDIFQDTGSTLTLAGGGMNAVIERLSGPSVIAATESVNASYTTTTGTTVNTGNPVIPFPIRSFDSHNSYNTSTGVYTAPVSGKYRVSATLTATVNLSSAQQFSVGFLKNGTFFRVVGNNVGAGGSASRSPSGSTLIDLLAGETVSVYGYSDVSTTLNTSAGFSHFSIERVGN